MLKTLTFGPYCLKRGTRILAEGVSLTLSPGDFIELLGDNGSGKTSLLNVLAGNVDVSDRYARWSGAAGKFYFAHYPGFHPEWSVRQQLVQSLNLYGVTLKDDAQLECLARVGMKRYAMSLVKTLSHGQQRRLLLAIMLAANQPLWLIDEPLNALDAAARQLFCDCLTQHLNQGGMAIVATHQSLLQLDASLTAQLAATVCIENKKANVIANPLKSTDGLTQRFSAINIPLSRAQTSTAQVNPVYTNNVKSTSRNTFLFRLMQREIALFFSRPADVLWPLVFFLMLVSMFPFASGAGRDTLMIIGVPVVWMATLLSVLMCIGKAFDEDMMSGAFVQFRVAGGRFQDLALAKLLLMTLSIGVPLGLASMMVAQLYHLPTAQTFALGISVVAGVPILMGLGLFFSALALLSRQAHLMTNLLALPVYVPVLIFGTTVAMRAQDAQLIGAPMAVLFGLDALTFLLLPWLIAKAIHLAIE